MKKNWMLRFGGLVIVLTLITSSLVAGTYAKYVTELTATDTVTVAKWQAELEANGTAITSETTTFDFFETTWSDTGVDSVDGPFLAPGTTGSFELAYDTSDSQVARNVTIEMNVGDLLTDLTYLELSTESGYDPLLSFSGGVVEFLDADFGPTDAGSGTITVYWRWPFESDATQDEADTADGILSDSYPVTVTFTATQLNEYPAP